MVECRSMQGSFLNDPERDVDVHVPSTGSHSHTVFETRSSSHPRALWLTRAAEALSRIREDAVAWKRSVFSTFISTG